MTETPVEPLVQAPPRPRRGLAIGAGAAALAVVAGAVVYATTALSGGGRQPDELVPRSAFAYVKVDLDPAAGQKLAARSFFDKLPKDGDALEDLLTSFLPGDLDYEKDVEPWFDKRAGVAAFPGAGDSVRVVAVLRSKDDGDARKSLDRVVADGDLAYRIERGYAVVGEQAAVDEAVAQTSEESIADNATYTGDVARLSGDQVAVGWADLGRAYDVATDAFPLAALLPVGGPEGRTVVGVHLTGDYAELQGLTIGAQDDAPATVDHAVMTGLPANTALALSFGDGGKTLDGDGAASLQDLVGKYLIGSGLSVTGDLLPLLGKQTAVAVGPFRGFSGLKAGIVTQVRDAEKARATADKVSGLAGFLGMPMKAEVSGDTFVLATPEGYATELTKGGGALGRSEKFRKAMGDLEGASFALYADVKEVQRAAAFFLGLPNTGLTSVGLVGGTREGESFYRLRLVA
ncbi:MAG TPA: DUF3352 domain-containing protein [Frankiaceae bacterium]|nr:DUF3352 domain-containing protein [Frankiaceae bacterium]